MLGANLARELYRNGYEIRLLLRAQSQAGNLADVPCEVFHGDISDAADVDKAVEGCRYVVHAASITQQWGLTAKHYERVNIGGTKNIVEACLAHGVERLVYISTANTFGPAGARPSNELDSFALLHIQSNYINSKYIAQQYVLEQMAARNLPVVVLNPTFMIGAYDAKPSSGQLMLHALNKRVVICPPGGKNFVHVRDVCLAIIQSFEKGKIGECYLVANENMTYKSFFRLLRDITGQKPMLVRIPGFVLKVLGIFGTLHEKLTGSPHKLSYSNAYMLSANVYYSGKKSERELLIRYAPVKNAMQDALAWFKDNNYC